MSMVVDDTISRRSRDVRQLLQDAVGQCDSGSNAHAQNGHNESADETGGTNNPNAIGMTDALERFTLWAGNLGALLPPTSQLSLDKRLSNAPETIERIYELLGELAEAISDFVIIISKPAEYSPASSDENDTNGKQSPGPEIVTSSSADDQVDECHLQLETISEYLRSLFQIAVLIRKSGTRDRFSHAIRNSNTAFTDIIDVGHLRDKYPKLSEKLQKLLGGANAKRRQFIKYCRDHKTRLANEERDEVIPEVTESRPARTEFLSSKATTYAIEPASGVDFNAPDLTLEENAALEDVISQGTVSTVSATNSTLTLPRLSKLSPDGRPFECPICCTIQTFHFEKAWKKHAFQDLRAYSCMAGCDKMFGDRDSWFEHELRQHRSQYNCSLCASPDLLDEADYKTHIRGNHGPFSDEQLQRLLDSSRQTVSVFRAQDCPFCDEWASALCTKRDPKGKQRQDQDLDISVTASRFRRHVGTHQEQISIFAVPRKTDDDEDNNEAPKSGTLGSMSIRQSLLSSDSDDAVELYEDSLAEDATKKSNVAADGHSHVHAFTPHLDYLMAPPREPTSLVSLIKEALSYKKEGWWPGAMPNKEEVEFSDLADIRLKFYLATRKWNEGQIKEAEDLQLSLLQDCSSRLGAYHPATLTRMHDLAQIYIYQGREQEAKVLLAAVIDVVRTKGNMNTPDAPPNVEQNVASSCIDERSRDSEVWSDITNVSLLKAVEEEAKKRIVEAVLARAKMRSPDTPATRDQGVRGSGLDGQPHVDGALDLNWAAQPVYKGSFDELAFGSLGDLDPRHDGAYHCADIEIGLSDCSASFKNLALLKKHMRGHIKPVLCPYSSLGMCGHRTAEQRDMKRHVVSTHPLWADINGISAEAVAHLLKCEPCEMQFTRSDNLRRHLRILHGKDLQDLMD